MSLWNSLVKISAYMNMIVVNVRMFLHSVLTLVALIALVWFLLSIFVIHVFGRDAIPDGWLFRIPRNITYCGSGKFRYICYIEY
jgi:hypothetical protein